jgi:hypothetical protein
MPVWFAASGGDHLRYDKASAFEYDEVRSTDPTPADSLVGDARTYGGSTSESGR